MAAEHQRYGTGRFAVIQSLLEAEGGGEGTKQPSEVQKLKQSQKQQEILSKQKDANELAAAERRDLDQKSREQMQKIAQSAKPKES